MEPRYNYQAQKASITLVTEAKVDAFYNVIARVLQRRLKCIYHRFDLLQHRTLRHLQNLICGLEAVLETMADQFANTTSSKDIPTRSS